MKSDTLRRYVGRQVYGAVVFVLSGFLALFAFFDLIGQMRDLGVGDYHLRQIATFVLLSMPTHAYELFPVSVLIGTLYVLAHLANNSEFTVMRAAGMSPVQAGRMLVKVGLVLAATAFAIGEWVAPHAEEAAQDLRRRAMSSLIGQDLESGLWFKDERSFINIAEARDAEALSQVKIYEFDAAYRLRMISAAKTAKYAGEGLWLLRGVAQTRLVAGDPAHSVLPLRLRATDAMTQMPPFGRHLADTTAIALIEQWIRTDLTRPAAGDAGLELTKREEQ